MPSFNFSAAPATTSQIKSTTSNSDVTKKPSALLSHASSSLAQERREFMTSSPISRANNSKPDFKAAAPSFTFSSPIGARNPSTAVDANAENVRNTHIARHILLLTKFTVLFIFVYVQNDSFTFRSPISVESSEKKVNNREPSTVATREVPKFDTDVISSAPALNFAFKPASKSDVKPKPKADGEIRSRCLFLSLSVVSFECCV